GASQAGEHELPSAADVLRASRLLAPVVRKTPLEPSERLTAATGAEVLLKREDLQIGRSYKVRGAYNVVASLSGEERGRGVVTASAGNHGQGVAFACNSLGIHAKVFLPTTTPRQKRARIEAIGGRFVELVVEGATYDGASHAAHLDAERTGAVYVHPFDDPLTIAGQGSVAVELTDQAGAGLDAVVVPVGGGGLVTGMALWLNLKQARE
ncbi:MAG: pyridoxal-phosphate dependent enzyme, partial [Actinomycetota bacterium]|nr:pyridoxal-phosphate dependent enzyme [Actinomycetota bacterium]